MSADRLNTSPFLPRAENESVCFLTGMRSGGKSPHGPEKERARQGKGCHACLSLRLNRKLKNSSCRYAPAPGLLSIFDCSRCRVRGASARPAARHAPSLAPGPVIGGTIKGDPAAGIVPVRELIEANRRNENIPMAEPIPGETVSPSLRRSPSRMRSLFPGKRTCMLRCSPQAWSRSFLPRLSRPFRFPSMKPA